MKTGKLFSWAFWGGVGLLALYFGYSAILEQITLRKYEALFAQVRHPSNSTVVDALRLSFSIYPATYIEEDIDFVPVYLVGELRNYTGNWSDVESFYEEHRQSQHLQYVVALPLMIDQSEQNRWLQIMDGVHYEPSDIAVIEELKYHYGWYGIPEKLDDTEQNVYLVYRIWWTPDEESPR